MENNTPSAKKFNNVILHLSQEMHCHVHIAKHPQDFSNSSTDPVELANISKENEALASEYADAISLLSSISNAIVGATKAEEQKEIPKNYLEEEILLLESKTGQEENNNSNKE